MTNTVIILLLCFAPLINREFYRMNKLFFSLPTFLISCFLVGCGPRTLNMGAENIHLYDSRNMKSCKFVGDIVNPSVHADLYLSSSVEDLQKDDINFLKNEGAKLGANVVVLVSHASYETKLKLYGGKAAQQPRFITINEHSIIGKAYNCPSGLVPNTRQKSTNHVKIHETPLI